MKYETEFDETNGICIVRVAGKHRRPDDSLELQLFARNFGDEGDCERYLFDMRQTKIIGGTMGAFKTGTVPVDQDHRQLRQKIALVYSGKMEDHRFMETVAVNRGYKLRVFDEVDKAIEWLKPKEDSTNRAFEATGYVASQFGH